MVDQLYIVVPAYNEAANIENLVKDWYPVVEQHDGGGASRLVVVNDGSKDDTYEILLKLAKDRPMLQPLTKKNGGHGPAVLFGYRYAVEKGADFIFQTDSDGQTNPDEFEAFWDKRYEYDAQFGNRTVRGDGQQRAFVEKTLCRLLKHYFKVTIPDSNAPFRLMTRDYVEEYIQKMPADYNLPNVMLTTFGNYYHRKIRFIPISFRPRQGGVNSINVKKIVKIGRRALKDFRNFREEMGA
ncbi:MAG: glycosyltransferase family 2 protein [Clostridiales bacterium]|uniref:glycosyltransferase family 2 protein n=1 Tax=Chordicoccus furentiruminis TaxID=2709410 RepID=UPI0023A844DD|nr:glycosyltransferase family 2 protein [Chordicoccus furentiruminis]MCI6174689.1 glycosyltransferase family 2 protein [Clostridiales bacterium]